MLKFLRWSLLCAVIIAIICGVASNGAVWAFIPTAVAIAVLVVLIYAEEQAARAEAEHYRVNNRRKQDRLYADAAAEADRQVNEVLQRKRQERERRVGALPVLAAGYGSGDQVPNRTIVHSPAALQERRRQINEAAHSSAARQQRREDDSIVPLAMAAVALSSSDSHGSSSSDCGSSSSDSGSSCSGGGD